MKLFYMQKDGVRSNVRYVDRAAVAAAMTEDYQRTRLSWGNVAGWVALGAMVGAFWYWALFC